VLVVELNNTKLEHKKLERDNQDLLQQKEKLAEELQEKKAEATEMKQLQAQGLQLAGLDGADLASGPDGRAKKKPDGPGANFFQKKKENLEDRARIAELKQSIEDQEQQIFVHKLEINSLKEQVVKLLEEKHYQSAVQLMESAQFLNQNAPAGTTLPDEGLQMTSAINP
jgi:hypothetical protein